MEKDSKIFLIAIIAIAVIVLISSDINLTGSAVRDKLGGNNFCSYEKGFICSSGQGDCDKDSDCIPGLKCVQNVGANYGFLKTIDVCEGASISSKSEKSGEVSGEEWGAEKIAGSLKYEKEVFITRVMQGKGTLKTSYSGSTWECFLSRDNKGELKIHDEILYSTASLPYNMVYLQECTQIGQTNSKKLEHAACVFVDASQSCTGKNEFYLLSIFDKEISLMPQNTIGKSGYPIIKEIYIDINDGTISQIHPATQFIYFMPK